ncbi:DUF4907 domain-containing protein [Flavobacterium sp. GA093]|uniref:DUF4907 domain-containing protein n=1 Tax=Flavobacterium hydrocarbonoxydans TaxID=2683249 RepID=A0A6I4NN88_9FLAO|nr:DUF4907 domain-containing protein [Flavobacterium hydrocarbonoxydans]MWB95593.1 DUF4907 domain-containing protein [Flavobacterium hydrocarbonoxydans]
MTINTKNKFFWSTIQKNLFLLLFLIAFAGCQKKDSFQTAAFQTSTGWGYTISTGNKIIIKQTIIPVISEVKSFSSEEDALKVAQLVATKLNQNISPRVSKNDLILLKIKI